MKCPFCGFENDKVVDSRESKEGESIRRRRECLKCEKRPISMGKLEQIVNDVEQFVVDSPERERTAAEIGELIMERLKQIDKVAYIRFASVYRDFQDVSAFHSELERLINSSTEKQKLPAKTRTSVK